jgi:hypothetical protein
VSEWRLIVREVASSDKPVSLTRFHPGSVARAEEHFALIKRISNHARNHGAEVLYVLTDLGREWIEGRIEERERRPGGRYMAATWLRALPQGMRIGAPPDVLL